MVTAFGAGIAQADLKFVGKRHSGCFLAVGTSPGHGREKPLCYTFAAPLHACRLACSPPMQLTLLIPELVWSDPDDRGIYDVLDASALSALIARGALSAEPPLAAEEWLAARFGLPAPAPIAALRGAGDGIDVGDAQWICADPVHLRFHQERLVLADESQIGLTAAESAALLATLNEHLGDLGEFIATGSGRWAVRLKQAVSRSAPPLSRAIGREVRLDALFADPLLKRAGHEAQMLLHTHPVNGGRETTGQMTVNALWFWGAGRLGGPPAAPGCRLFSSAPVAHGLARLGGAAIAPPPKSLAEFLRTGPATDAIVELDALALPASYENGPEYLEVWKRLDQDWFGGLGRALRSGRIGALKLVVPSAFGLLTWSLTRLAVWKFWANRTPLSARVSALAAKGTVT